MNLRRASNANGGDILGLWRHCCEYTEPLRTTDSGCFSGLGGGGWLPLCYKILRRISEFGAVFDSCWVTFVGCCEFHGFNYGIFREEIKCGEIKPWNNKDIFISLVLSAERGVTKHFLKYLENKDLTKNISGVGQKPVLTHACYRVRKFLGHTPWSSGIGWFSFPRLGLVPPTVWDRWRLPSR